MVIIIISINTNILFPFFDWQNMVMKLAGEEKHQEESDSEGEVKLQKKSVKGRQVMKNSAKEGRSILGGH